MIIQIWMHLATVVPAPSSTAKFDYVEVQLAYHRPEIRFYRQKLALVTYYIAIYIDAWVYF